jgi:hypothetical protein
MKRLAALLVLVLPAAALAQDEHKVPVKPAEIAYDDVVKCQGLYLAFSGNLEPGSEDYEFMAEMFGIWYDYHAEYYPTGFDEHYTPDTHGARDAIFAQADAAASEAEFDAILDGYSNRCADLEETVLLDLR